MVNFTSPPRTGSSVPKAPLPGSIPQPKPDGFPGETVPDWNNIGLFTAGIALGAILGASVALLFAPASGDETRERIGRRVRRSRAADDVWDELAEELKRAAAEDVEEEVEELKETLKT
jgi:YtxH-like protein